MCVKAQSTLCGERPAATLTFLVNVLWVVVGDELVRHGLTENQPSDCGENDRYSENHCLFGFGIPLSKACFQHSLGLNRARVA